MITTKHLFIISIPLVIASFVIPGLCRADAQVLKLATMAPEGSIWMKEIDLLNSDLETRTGGRFKIKIYPGGIMGDDDVVLRKIRVGQLDGALFTTNALSKINKDLLVLTYPGLFRTSQEVDTYLERQSDFFAECLRSKGYEILGIMSLGFTYSFSTMSINSLEDMKSAKAWLWDNDPVMTSMYSHLGVTPVSVGIGDVMTALQTGLLNTVFNTPTGIVSLQWYTRVKQMLDFPLTHSFGAFVLKSQTWEKIPEDLRPIIKDAIHRHALEITRKTREEDIKARQVINDKNISIVTPSDPLAADLRLIFEKAIEDLQKLSETSTFYESISKNLIEIREQASSGN